jgi:hypothetical protein
MASFGRSYSGPVLTMSPQPFPQATHSVGGFSNQHASLNPFNFAPTQTTAAPTRPAAGRKRSRDEAAPNLESDAPPPKPAQLERGWTYGPGMVLIKPDSGYSADAGSQSGTWLEDKAAVAKATQRQQEASYVEPRNVKSQRVHRDGEPSPTTLTSPANPLSQGQSTLSQTNSDAGPIIDDFTLHLGIGWRRISADEHIQAAARGWARYIENHYPLSNVNICLESKGLASYLVESTQGYFLFAENLREGRLLSTTIQGAMQNLQSSPPTFEGPGIMLASESPSPRPTETPFFTQAVDSEMAMS